MPQFFRKLGPTLLNPSHCIHEGRYLRPVAFVLPPRPESAESLETKSPCNPKILHSEYPAIPKDLKGFLGIALRAVGEIMHRTHRAVGKSQEDRHFVFPDRSISSHHHRRNGRNQTPSQIRQQINKMACLANNPSAAALRIMRPVLRRNVSLH